MAKTYDFRFILRKAIFSETDGVGFVTIPYGSSADVYHESCAEMTYADAQRRLAELSAAELSAAEPRPHRAFLTMKYRDDRVPPGFNKNPNYIDGKGDAQ